jgi:hypothetical protein
MRTGGWRWEGWESGNGCGYGYLSKYLGEEKRRYVYAPLPLEMPNFRSFLFFMSVCFSYSFFLWCQWIGHGGLL